jgi:hypothetical protein
LRKIIPARRNSNRRARRRTRERKKMEWRGIQRGGGGGRVEPVINQTVAGN